MGQGTLPIIADVADSCLSDLRHGLLTDRSRADLNQVIPATGQVRRLLISRRGCPSRRWELAQMELIWLAVLAMVFIVAVLAHECGHLLAGWVLGFQFERVALGPFAIARTPQGLRLTRVTVRLDVAGHVCSWPTSDHHVRLRLAAVAAAGPAADLVVAGCALLAVRSGLTGAGNGAGPTTAGALAIILLCIALLSFASNLLTPAFLGGKKTDGAAVRLLLRGGPKAARHCALILALHATHNSPEQPLAEQVLDAAAALPDGSIQDFFAHFFRWRAAMSHTDVVRAGVELDYILSLSNGPPGDAARSELLVEAGFYSARFARDPAATRQWIAIANPTANDRPRALWALAHAAYSEGDIPEALRLLEEARVAITDVSNAELRSRFQRALDAEAALISSAPTSPKVQAESVQVYAPPLRTQPASLQPIGAKPWWWKANKVMRDAYEEETCSASSSYASRMTEGAACACARQAQRVRLTASLFREAQLGVRPREWNPDDVARLAACTDGCPASHAALTLLYSHALDLNDVPTAGARIGALLNVRPSLPANLAASISTEGAYFWAVKLRDPWAGQRIAPDNLPAGVPAYCWLQARAARALARGDYATAARTAREALAAVPDAPYPGIHLLERDCLHEVIRLAETGAHAGTADVAAAPGD